ncbi:MAG: hypothetical protein K5857_02405 [Lachnospiraceae bacterium]|nr:hypothetical protein [Lachnospiraceae bacterium]
MRKEIKRSIVYGMAAIMTAGALTGCGLIESTGLSQEEEDLVAEYAAGVLMRYSAGETGGLGDLRPTPTPIPWNDPAEVKPTEAPEEETGEEEDTDMEEEVPIEEVEGREDVSGQTPGGALNGRNLASAIGIGDFDITYEGFEAADVYPETTGNDLSFSMQATPGRKLLIVHLNVINDSSEDKVCDVLSQNVKFRVVINENKRINEQMTILLNDLKAYNDTIPAGSSADTVLVFEAEDQVIAGINTLSLVVVNQNGESVFSL